MNIDTKQAFELGYQQGYANGKLDGDEMGYRVGREAYLFRAVEVLMDLAPSGIVSPSMTLIVLQEATDAINALREGLNDPNG